MPAYIKILVVFFASSFLINACSSASSANAIPTGTPADIFTLTPPPTKPSTPTQAPTNVPTKEPASPTPDAKFHELTQDEIDNIDVRNYVKYIKISSAEKQQYVDYIANNLKITVSVKPAKLSESFTDFGYQEIQLNLTVNRNIIPRFALEIDGVRTTVYEVKILNPDGTVYQGSFFVSEADTVSNGIESWKFNYIIQTFQNDSHKELIIWLILGTPQSNNAAKNPYATKLTNVTGQEATWDSMRTKLKETDAFASDMSATIWWAKPMN